LNGVLALVLPTLPGLFWLVVFYKTDKYQPEPKSLVIQTFVLGIASVVPTLLIHDFIRPFYDDSARIMLLQRGGYVSDREIAFIVYFIVGPAEELSKFLAVRVWAYRKPAFDEPPDGVVYAAAAALGFASFENIKYVNMGGHFSEGTLLIRSVLSVPGHVLFSLAWGAALSYARFHPGARAKFAQVLGIAAAAGLHGTYDYFAFTHAVWADVPLMVCMTYMAWVIVRTLRRASPFSEVSRARAAALAAVAPTPIAIAVDPALAKRHSYPPWLPGGYAPPSEAAVCARCGARAATQSDRFCGSCGTPLSSAA
jgi:RsiW-degrading membrane proteinase PrsW (M82 family)